MASIVYKTALPDADQYWALFETTGWNSDYRVDAQALGRALANSWYVVAAYDGDALIGIGRVTSDGVLYAMIYDLIVQPGYQGRGIGTTILKKLVKHCKAAALREIQLFSAKGKESFYRLNGFVKRPGDAPGMQLEQH